MSNYFSENNDGIGCRIFTKLKVLIILLCASCTGVNAQNTFDEEELREMLYGLSFLGSGGGGGYGDGQIILSEIIAVSPSGLTLDGESIASDDTLVVGAAIGSPESLDQNLDGLIVAVNAAIDLTLPDGADLKSVLSVETGPANSFIAALVNLNNGAPTFDGDGAGRSVPSLTNTTYSIQKEYPISPVAIAAAPDDPSDPPPQSEVLDNPVPKDAADAETEIRDLISSEPAYGNVAGLALWTQTGSEFKDAPYIDGTYTFAYEIGRIMKANDTNFFQMVAQLEPIMAFKNRAILGSDLGVITEVTSTTTGGFDIGLVRIYFNNAGTEYTAEIKSENENLVSSLTFIDPNDKVLKTLSITAPTLISMVIKDPASGLFVPYNNGDNLEQFIGAEIGLVWSLADSRLYDDTNGFLDSFITQLRTTGYEGPVCPDYNDLSDPWGGCLKNGSISDNIQGWPRSIFDLISVASSY